MNVCSAPRQGEVQVWVQVWIWPQALSNLGRLARCQGDPTRADAVCTGGSGSGVIKSAALWSHKEMRAVNATLQYPRNEAGLGCSGQEGQPGQEVSTVSSRRVAQQGIRHRRRLALAHLAHLAQARSGTLLLCTGNHGGGLIEKERSGWTWEHGSPLRPNPTGMSLDEIRPSPILSHAYAMLCHAMPTPRHAMPRPVQNNSWYTALQLASASASASTSTTALTGPASMFTTLLCTMEPPRAEDTSHRTVQQNRSPAAATARGEAEGDEGGGQA
ncbi:hypothetical protein J7T55_006491 [Diaporthe amygdali]|uniref:uncharacterized protein n=1 Tax=Phomopsis amygdali TaxID=1214568 RepID=UPI0022FE2434|nr:uncharacterized protein J7T55_006491 [Diaporthe amygdali]KAJ0125147.1 hypothetical protein J7T55_006491 [Diaporthe amygdali]